MRDVDEPRSSDPIDPFQGLSALSLFPRTIRASKSSPNPNHTSDNLESIHGFMKSMVLRSPRKHSEQAKAIVDGNSKLVNSNFASLVAHENKNEAVVAKKVKENARVRRPGLGLKRAHFSLKANSSQPSANLEPTLDIDKLEDPEDFLLAYEKLENAKKEIRRQRGENVDDINYHNMPRAEPRRRPGILGKSYKHRYSSMLPESDDTFMPSQVRSAQDTLSPLNYTSQPEQADPNVELQEKELTGSISKTENRLNGLLDELLSEKCDLDQDGVLSFLQERLQIKPLDLDKLCLPDFHDVGNSDFLDLEENMPKPRNTLSDTQNLGEGISGKTPVKHKQAIESTVYSLTSPTPPRSPFASLSLLKKRIFQSDLRNDPFSALDLSPARNSSPVEPVDEQSDEHKKRKKFELSGELKALVTEIGDIRVDDAGSQEILTRDSITPLEKSTNDNSGRLDVGINVMPSRSYGDLIDNDGSGNIDDRAVDDNDSRLNPNTDVRTNGPNKMEENDIGHNTGTDTQGNGPSEMEDNVGDMMQDSSTPYTEFRSDGPKEIEKNVVQTNVEDMPHDAQPDINIEHPTEENLDGNKSQQDQSSAAAVEPHPVDGLSETSDAIPEQHIENVQEPSKVSLNERSTAKRPPRGKRKTISHRQSLAGAGTSFDDKGLRRSKRIKMRPLEYWKGERFLYGRIHESLATVIGVKYVSPAKGGGKSSIRVQSYVSDEYQELVDLAALH